LAAVDSPLVETLRVIVPLAVALGVSVLLDRRLERRGLLPPGFQSLPRRAAALALVASVLFLGVFLTAAYADRAGEIDTSQISIPQLFVLHLLLLASVVAWFVLGYALPRRVRPLAMDEDIAAPTVERPALWRVFADQFGLRTRGMGREIAIGVGVGVGSWFGVLLSVALIAVFILTLGKGDLLPTTPSSVIPWMAGLPIALRMLLALSAGVVEELFFRGFLQPRIGIVLSTVCFALAHLSYGQPFLLVGITMLSFIYGAVVIWRQSLWAAIVAHVLFDAIQLLVVIPMALRYVEGSGAVGP
jgi:membrane protease YdiL (CAAX protease family)